jgi:hypothetical protein
MVAPFFRATVLAALTVITPAVLAQAAAPAVQEIHFLLDAVGQSKCQFNRNGSWYEADEARAHLQKKFDYLDKRKQAPTAEAFIERGASTSSVSGKAYQMRCPGMAPVTSAAWLTEQLARYRKERK